MTKLQSIVSAIMMTVLVFLGLDGDGYVHKGALFWAGFMACLLVITASMEWKGLD